MPGMPGMLDEDEFGVFFGAPSGLAPQATILPLPKPATAPIGKDGKVIEDDDDVYTQLFGPPPAVPMPPRYVFAKPIMPLVVLPAAAQLPVPVGRPGAAKAAQGATRNGTSAAAGAPQSEGGGAGAAVGGRGGLAGSLEGGAALGLASGGPSMEMMPLQGAPAPPPEEDDDFEVTLEELDTATMAAAAVAAGGTTTAPAAGPAAGVAAATGGRLGSVGSGSLPGLGPPPPPPPGEVAAAGRVPPPRPPPGGPPLPPGGPPGVVPGPKPPAGGPPVPGPGAGPKFGPGPPGGRPFLPRQPQPIYGLNFRYSIEEAAWPTEARLDQAIKLPKQTRVTPEEYRAFLSLGHGEIFELDLDRIIPHEALWRNPSANPGDYFNYDMNETSWRHYCARVRTYRDTFTLRTRIAVLDPAAVAAVLACSPAGATRPGGGPNAVEWIDPALPSEVVAALRAWQRSGRKGQRREEEEEDVAAAAAATATAESIVFSEMTIDITAMGGGDWDGNEGGYGMLAGRLGREAPLNRRTTPRLDTDVIMSLTEAEDFIEEEEEPTPTTAAAETAPTVKPEPTAVSDEGAAGPRPPAAEVPPSEEAVGEAMAPQTTSTTAGAASVAASEGTNGPLGSNGASEPPQALPITTTTSRTTLAVVAGGGSGGGIEQQRVVVARPKQRRRLNPLINVDYDTVPGVWEPPPGVSVGQQLTKRGRSPPPDYRHREWDRDRDVDRGGRYDLRPAMPHLPHPHLMAMGHGGMEPAGREMDMDPRDLMGHMGMGDDVYLDGGGGGDDDEDDEEPNGGGGAGTIGREHGGKDRDGGGGGGSGVTKRSSEISGGEGGRSGPAAPPAKPETLPLPQPAVFLPPPPHLPSPPASQLQGPIEVKHSATNGMEAANRAAQPTDQNPSELSIQLPYPPEVKPETVQEPIGWDPHGAAAVYGDFGGGGDFYMDDGYGDDDQDDHVTPPQVAPAEPTSGGHIGESAMQHHPTQQRLAEAVQSVDRLEDAGTDDHHHHDSASDAVGHSYKYNASGPTNLTESGAAMPSAVTQMGGAREDDDDSSLRHHSPSALRHSDYSRHPNGDVTADDFGKPPASVLPDADALFGDGGGHGANGGGGGGGGLSVLDLLNPMAAMGGMAGMGAHMGPLGPMGHMGALGAMQGLGMPSLMPGGMPSLMAAPGGDMLGALGLMPPIQPHGAGGAEGPGGGGMKVEGGGGQRSMRPERPGNGRPSRSRSRSRRSHSRSRDRERAVRRGSDRIRSRSRDRRDRDRDRRSPSRDRDRDRERERDRDRDRDRERGGGGRDRRRSRSRDRDRDRERDKDRDRRDRDRDRDRDRRDRDRR